MKFNADKILREWSWRVGNGMPDVSNDDHITTFMEILYEQNYSFRFIKELVNNITEDWWSKMDSTAQAAYIKAHPKSAKAVQARKEKEAKKDEPTSDEPSTDKEKSKEIPKKGSKDDTPAKTAPEDKNILPADDLIKYMEGRYGIDSKVEKALEKFPNKFGEAEKAKVKALENDFKDFAKNPTEEGAKALVHQYQLSTNQGGNKLYLGFVVGVNIVLQVTHSFSHFQV